MKALTTSVAIAALAAVLASASAAQAGRAYIGTYTPNLKEPGAYANGHGEGIYLVNVDDATGVPSGLKLVAKDFSPSWFTLSKDNKFLYAVNEINTYGSNKSGSITAYAVDAATGALKKLNVVDSGGAIPCFIVPDPSGKFVLTANYTGGSYSVTRLKPDGSLGETTDIVKPSGPLSVYQAADRPVGMSGSKEPHGSRGHMILPDPTGQYIVGADAGRDQVFVWKLDTNTGKLNQVSVTKVVPGSGPRHFRFSPDGKALYVLHEQNSRIQVYGFDAGKLTPKGASVSTLPDGFQGGNTTSELLIDKAGKHLYAANRNHDSIATFAIATDSSIKKIANTHTEGTIPRTLAFDPSGKYFYSLNQGGDNLATFKMDANGVPKSTGKFLAVYAPAAMVFLP
ncbi:MAG: lactonase family protein [Alphaproteobacteria bacterium]|nr:lactonase family protein [Alphaproteobacteria bacterium]